MSILGPLLLSISQLLSVSFNVLFLIQILLTPSTLLISLFSFLALTMITMPSLKFCLLRSLSTIWLSFVLVFMLLLLLWPRRFPMSNLHFPDSFAHFSTPDLLAFTREFLEEFESPDADLIEALMLALADEMSANIAMQSLLHPQAEVPSRPR